MAPLHKMRSTGAAERMRSRSFGTALRMELSDEPTISHEAIISHRAIWCANKNAVFSTVDRGGISQNTSARTRQNRFCGCA